MITSRIMDEAKKSSQLLVDAVSLREKYMNLSGQQYSKTANLFLKRQHTKQLSQNSRSGTADVPPMHLAQLSHGVPSTFEKDPFAIGTIPPSANYALSSANGIIEVKNPVDGNIIPDLASAYVPFSQFCDDYDAIHKMAENGLLRTLCATSLDVLQLQFRIHKATKGNFELRHQTAIAAIVGRDVYTVTKVNTHEHAARSMTAYALAKFIKTKLQNDGDRVVGIHGDNVTTLKDVFDELKLEPKMLTADLLEVRADHDIFERFDIFNQKGMPAGKAILRQIFLKTNNSIDGLYYAEILKEGFAKLESKKCEYSELRLPIYGKARDEWENLANWIDKHKVHSKRNRWVIQFPRLYNEYRTKGIVGSFKEILDNFFIPLFEATKNPRANQKLHVLLRYVVGFDLVGDESKRDAERFGRDNPPPGQWTSGNNPPYAYQMYYFFANIAVLNKFRKLRGMNTFSFRPHCGESGSRSHLIAGFLTSESIVHGLNLAKVPVLHYLYYLTEIPIAMSPASNNKLFALLPDNPFPTYFKQGLLVSLSTDDPLQFHFGKEDPLSEEYALAHHLWRLNNVDLCEIARLVERLSARCETILAWRELLTRRTQLPRLLEDYCSGLYGCIPL